MKIQLRRFVSLSVTFFFFFAPPVLLLPAPSKSVMAKFQGQREGRG